MACHLVGTKPLFHVCPHVLRNISISRKYTHDNNNYLIQYDSRFNKNGHSYKILAQSSVVGHFHVLVVFAPNLVPRPLPPPPPPPHTHRRGRINFWLSILARTGGVVEPMLGSVFIIELDAGWAGVYFHRYCTDYDVCHKQNT